MSNWYYPPPQPQEVPKTIFDDIEQIKAAVGRYFPIYNTQVHFDTVSMYCTVDANTLEQNFDNLRKDLRGMAYIPLITKEKGEHIVHVVKRPPEKFRGPWLNLVLLMATIASTIIAGAALWAAVFNTGSAFAADNLGNGALYFAFPLMLILSVHEMAHYFAAKSHGVAASLPFFIPAPFILGTFGAFISIREPIPSKKALIDIGFAGPIAGFLVAIPVLCIGLILSGDMAGPVSGDTIQGGTMLIGTSLLFEAFMAMFGLSGGGIHPLAFAGWVGFFVTALNLLPVGQLDGGHIARAVLGEKSRWAGYGAIGAMLILGLVFSSSWLFFALLIMFMGLRHPPPLNDVTLLTNGRKAVGIVAAAMLILCFVPVPISNVPINYDFTFQEADATPVGPYFSHSIDKSPSSSWQNITYPFKIHNNGNMPLDLRFNISHSPWDVDTPINTTVWLYPNGETDPTPGPYSNISLEIGQTVNMTLRLMVDRAINGTQITIDVTETAYRWESSTLSTENRTPHGMRVKVNFNLLSP